MALLAGLPLDVVDALSNGGACNAEDIASLRLACSTLRSQVDGTLQRLRPTCDLSALRVLPSTWRVVSCIDLSAIDLRLLSSAALLASSGGLTRHLELTLNQLPCLTELVISESFAREMGRKCWAAAVCNSIFKDVASDQQQRHRQQEQPPLQQQPQQQQQQQLVVAPMPALPPLVVMQQPPATNASEEEGTPSQGFAFDVPTSPTAHRSSPELAAQQQQRNAGASHETEQQQQQQQQEWSSNRGSACHEQEALPCNEPTVQEVNGDEPFAELQLQDEEQAAEVWGWEHDWVEHWWLQQQRQQGLTLDFGSLSREHEEDEGSSERNALDMDGMHEGPAACGMLNPGPSCLLDCPRELMWTSGFRAFDAAQFTISPASPVGSCTPEPRSPIASPAATAGSAASYTSGVSAAAVAGAGERAGGDAGGAVGAGMAAGLGAGRCESAGRDLRSDQGLRGTCGGGGGGERAGQAYACTSAPRKRPSRGAPLSSPQPPSCAPQPVQLRWGDTEPVPQACAGQDPAPGAGHLVKAAPAPAPALAPAPAPAPAPVPAPTSPVPFVAGPAAADSDCGSLEDDGGPEAGMLTLPAAYVASRLRAEGSASCGLLTAQGSLEGPLFGAGGALEGAAAGDGGGWATCAADEREGDRAAMAEGSSDAQAGLTMGSEQAAATQQQQQQVEGIMSGSAVTTGAGVAPVAAGSAVAAAPTHPSSSGGTASASMPASPDAAAAPGGVGGDACVATPQASGASTGSSSCSAVPDPAELAYFYAAAEDPHANMSAVVWLPDWPSSLLKLHTLRIHSGSGSGSSGRPSAAPSVGGGAGAAGAAAATAAGQGMGMTTLLWARRSALCNVRTIDLSGTRLGALPPDLLACCLPPTLRCLRLAGCGLVSLPPSLSSLVSLRELDVSRNALRELPELVSHLTCLTRLDVSDNQLATLPSSLGTCVALERLNLAGNQLRSPLDLPLRELAALPALTWLSLAHNWLEVEGSSGGGGGGGGSRGARRARQSGAAPGQGGGAGDGAEERLVPEAHGGAALQAAAAAPGRAHANAGPALPAMPLAAAAAAGAAAAQAAAAADPHSSVSAAVSSVPALPSRLVQCWAPVPGPSRPQPAPWLGQLLGGSAASSILHLDLSNAGFWRNALVLPWDACLALKSLRNLNLSGNCGGLMLGPVPAGTATTAAGASHSQDCAPLPGLRHLDISQCALEELPEILALMPGLDTLDARGNCLAALPPWTSCMVALRHLHLGGNADLLLALEEGVGGVEGVAGVDAASPCIGPQAARWLRSVAVHRGDWV